MGDAAVVGVVVVRALSVVGDAAVVGVVVVGSLSAVGVVVVGVLLARARGGGAGCTHWPLSHTAHVPSSPNAALSLQAPPRALNQHC